MDKLTERRRDGKKQAKEKWKGKWEISGAAEHVRENSRRWCVSKAVKKLTTTYLPKLPSVGNTDGENQDFRTVNNFEIRKEKNLDKKNMARNQKVALWQRKLPDGQNPLGGKNHQKDFRQKVGKKKQESFLGEYFY